MASCILYKNSKQILYDFLKSDLNIQLVNILNIYYYFFFVGSSLVDLSSLGSRYPLLVLRGNYMWPSAKFGDLCPMIRCDTIKNSTCSKVVAMVCRDMYLSLTMLTLLHVYNRNIRHGTGCKIYQVMFLWYLGAPKHMIRILFILFNCSKTNFTVFFENKYCWKRKDDMIIVP